MSRDGRSIMGLMNHKVYFEGSVFFLMLCYFCFQAIFINNVFICPAKMGALGIP